jgi:hypothetical protein
MRIENDLVGEGFLGRSLMETLRETFGGLFSFSLAANNPPLILVGGSSLACENRIDLTLHLRLFGFKALLG